MAGVTSSPDPTESWDAVRARVRFDDRGLVPAVAQQWDTGEVLMLGWMDREAMRRTLTEGRVTFWSRSRQEYWRKGDTSGNVQKPATLETGLVIQVPLFVKEGEVVRVSTADGTYLGRA